MRRFIFLLSWLAMPLAHAADVAAVLQWSQRVELSVPVSGVVKSVAVNAGDQVKQGQLLLSLDGQLFQARQAESRAALARHKEELAEAKRDLERVQELYNRTVISTTELDQAKLRHARAKGLYEEAQARLAQDSKSLQDSQLRAPFDALVLVRQVEPGQAVASGLQPQTLLVLARAGEMLARFKLYDNQIGQFKPGQTLTVEVAGQSYPGKIKTLGLEPVPGKEEALYPVDVVFYPKQQLRAGMPAKVKLP